MLSVLLVKNYRPDQQKSMLAYAALVERTFALSPAVRLLPVEPAAVLWTGQRRPEAGLSKLLAYVDKYLLFPVRLRMAARRADVIHICDHSNALYAHALPRERVLVTCHDVLAIESAAGKIEGWRTRITGRILQRLILSGLKKARAIVCVSAYTRDHLVALGVPRERTTVALNPLNFEFGPASEKDVSNSRSLAGLGTDASYLLHVGSDLARKNRAFALEVFAAFVLLQPQRRTHLVFVGPPLSDTMRARATQLGLADQIVCVQDVSASELNAFYTGALALVFPSLHEGFGWPIIEAQAAGCPVATNPALPMSEVGGSGAAYLDLEDARRSAQMVLELVEARDEWAVRGFVNLKRFSIDSLRDEYLSAYQAIGASACG
jgi:glycosyltransferase involved in cell wall biosynthesis